MLARLLAYPRGGKLAAFLVVGSACLLYSSFHERGATVFFRPSTPDAVPLDPVAQPGWIEGDKWVSANPEAPMHDWLRRMGENEDTPAMDWLRNKTVVSGLGSACRAETCRTPRNAHLHSSYSATRLCETGPGGCVTNLSPARETWSTSIRISLTARRRRAGSAPIRCTTSESSTALSTVIAFSNIGSRSSGCPS